MAASPLLRGLSGSAVFRAQFFFVDLSDAGSRERLDEKDSLGDSELGDDSPVAIDFHMGFDIALAHRRLGLRIAYDQGHRPLAPFLVGDADHRAFGDAGALRDNVFKLQRRYPFAARLDDVLDTIGDLEITVGMNDGDVIGMEIAASPQLLG